MDADEGDGDESARKKRRSSRLTRTKKRGGAVRDDEVDQDAGGVMLADEDDEEDGELGVLDDDRFEDGELGYRDEYVDDEAGGDSAKARRRRRLRQMEREKEDKFIRTAGGLLVPKQQTWKTRTPLDLNSLKQYMLIRRTALERLVDEPYFEDYVKGKFVRVGIGQNSSGPVYRLCQVVNVADYARAYDFAGAKIRRGLTLKYGKAERVFRMNLVSNRSPTLTEFQQWVAEMSRHSLEIPCQEEARASFRLAEHMRKTFVYDEETVAQLVQKRQAKSLRHTNLAREVAMARTQLDTARDEGREEDVRRLLRRVEELEEHLRSKRSMLLADNENTNKLSIDINRKSREVNLKAAEAIARRERQQRLQRLRDKKAGIRVEEDVVDPFQRRATRPALAWQPKKDRDDSKSKQNGKLSVQVPQQQETSAFASLFGSPTAAGSPRTPSGGGAGTNGRRASLMSPTHIVAISNDPLWRQLSTAHSNARVDEDLMNAHSVLARVSSITTDEAAQAVLRRRRPRVTPCMVKPAQNFAKTFTLDEYAAEVFEQGE
eukprot:TRINITY_DN66467_c1_g1_i1.p2 TRINITY_DN66467_c1_g1~~TRINITY_DN66467_c1_g1_i1.p2  ORF type:complete len:565 (-),score=364.59 TRINITY_DN66467_c1_g1_i1:71-1708(-)